MICLIPNSESYCWNAEDRRQSDPENYFWNAEETRSVCFGGLFLECSRYTICLIRRVILGMQQIHDLSDSEDYFGNATDTRSV